jgi:hypothetical protein
MVKLPDGIQGSLKPGLDIAWTQADGTILDLNGAILTGKIFNVSDDFTRNITGLLTITSAIGGLFSWAFSAADVATRGLHWVQFSAAYPGDATPAKTFNCEWYVELSL